MTAWVGYLGANWSIEENMNDILSLGFLARQLETRTTRRRSLIMISKPNCLFAAAFATFLCATTSFAQENRGTPEQQAACAPDAFRLCSSYIPDPGRVERCLRQQKARLSASCRALFDQHAGAAETTRQMKPGGARASTTMF
jgi:hypothetical protein